MLDMDKTGATATWECRTAGIITVEAEAVEADFRQDKAAVVVQTGVEVQAVVVEGMDCLHKAITSLKNFLTRWPLNRKFMFAGPDKVQADSRQSNSEMDF